MEQPKKLKSMAWLLRGVSSLPGILKLAENRLTFTAFGFGTFWKYQLKTLERDTGQQGLADKLDNGETALVLDYPLNDVAFTFPWYYFSGGLKIHVKGITYKFSFGRPANSQMGYIDKDAMNAINQLKEVGYMREVGKEWRKCTERF